MAHLDILTISGSSNSTAAANFHFPWLAHHVKELFLSRLPRDFVLDGSRKIHLHFGEAEKPHFCSSPVSDDPNYERELNVSMYWLRDFNMQTYIASDGPERDAMVLLGIVDALTKIAQVTNKNPTAHATIIESSRGVEANNFADSLPIRKLWKRSNAGEAIEIYRVLNRNEGESWEMRIQHGNQLKHRQWMVDHPCYIDRTDFFKKSSIQGRIFTVTDQTNWKVFEFDVENLVEIAIPPRWPYPAPNK